MPENKTAESSGRPYAFPGQTGYYKGKVRNVYFFGDKVVMIASDRISAFDHILPRPIPYKGQVLNQMAAYFLNATASEVPNWLLAVPDPCASAGILCEPIRVEMVIRGYLAGHAWREYSAGTRTLCGIRMPEGMREGDQFPEPIITPAIKAESGHDEDISAEDIIRRGILSSTDFAILEDYTHTLFTIGSSMANGNGLILVDTKYEFGRHDGKIFLIDEVHTPDSSRYYYLSGYKERQERGERQQQLSKEFVREWLMSRGFQGLDGQKMPEMPDDFVSLISERYIELYERMTAQAFVPMTTPNPEDRIEMNVLRWLKQEGIY
ncbi:MAG TPA: phosphoribosylaminoimidazolesuccinocarboxamide synthase [Saprospiraceae bacterium]|nr:phosphoribosylaminoimidazolesuccinocarboxamide synthase [Saprospiraceae bacterium]